MAAGYGIISQADTLLTVMAGTVVAGFGLGPLLPNQTTWLMGRTPEASRGKAAGLLTTAVFAGQFVSPLLAGVVANQFGTHGVFTTFAVLLVVAALALFVFGRRNQSVAA